MEGAKLGVVVIGRNEGDRLRVSLEAVLRDERRCVYVDSGSTDGSAELARGLGAVVVELPDDRPFTAARSRNAGLAELQARFPEVELAQFVDGDCEIEAGWLGAAASALATDPGLAAVCGILRERHPEASVYNRLCGLEWWGLAGEVQACGGTAMYRVKAMCEGGRFREDLIAGEEPELCLRLRRAGWRFARIDVPMAVHDAAMLHFSQWWTRSIRSGHTYAEAAWLHGRGPERFRVVDVLRNFFWGLALPGLALVAAVPTRGLSLALLLAYFLQFVRIARRKRAEGFSWSDSGLYARYCLLGKFPGAAGQCLYAINLLRGTRTGLIEYK